jgi:formate dehydrogenase assembly factor FdhD
LALFITRQNSRPTRKAYEGENIRYRDTDIKLLIDAQNRQREYLEKTNAVEAIVASGLKKAKDGLATEIARHGTWGKVIGGVVKEAGEYAIDGAFKSLAAERDRQLIDNFQARMKQLPNTEVLLTENH